MEIVGGLLIFGLGTCAVSLWFALQKLNMQYTLLEGEHEALILDYLTVLGQEIDPEVKDAD